MPIPIFMMADLANQGLQALEAVGITPEIMGNALNTVAALAERNPSHPMLAPALPVVAGFRGLQRIHTRVADRFPALLPRYNATNTTSVPLLGWNGNSTFASDPLPSVRTSNFASTSRGPVWSQADRRASYGAFGDSYSGVVRRRRLFGRRYTRRPRRRYYSRRTFGKRTRFAPRRYGRYRRRY